LKKEEHIKFIDTIDERAEKAKQIAYNETHKMLKRFASESGGSLQKFVTMVKKSRKIATQKTVKKVLPIVKDVRSISRKFAEEKINAV
jgi:hypothetical protein